MATFDPSSGVIDQTVHSSHSSHSSVSGVLSAPAGADFMVTPEALNAAQLGQAAGQGAEPRDVDVLGAGRSLDLGQVDQPCRLDPQAV